MGEFIGWAADPRLASQQRYPGQLDQIGFGNTECATDKRSGKAVPLPLWRQQLHSTEIPRRRSGKIAYQPVEPRRMQSRTVPTQADAGKRANGFVVISRHDPLHSLVAAQILLGNLVAPPGPALPLQIAAQD